MKKINQSNQQTGLQKSIQLTQTAAQVGFDWPNTDSVFAKIQEEIEELQVELARETVDQKRVSDELGDIFFVLANLARKLALDPDVSIHGANQKFSRRFGFIEETLNQQGKKLIDSTLAEMNALWDQAKVDERR